MCFKASGSRVIPRRQLGQHCAASISIFLRSLERPFEKLTRHKEVHKKAFLKKVTVGAQPSVHSVSCQIEPFSGLQAPQKDTQNKN